MWPRRWMLIALLVPLIVSLACLPGGLIPLSTPTPSPAITPSPAFTPTATPVPPSPTPSPMPTPYPVARPGTPSPAGVQRITLDNLKRLVPVARWGEGAATKLVCSPKDPLIALGTTVGVTLYEAENLNAVASFSDDWVTSLAFSPDGSLLAVGRMDGRVQIWDVRQRKEVRTIEVSTDQQIKGLAFSPDGRWLASIWEGVLQVWDVATGQERQLMRYHDVLMDVRFLPPGDRVVAGTFDGGLVVWRVEDGSRLADVSQGHTPVASMEVTRDGRQIVINADTKARVVQGPDFSVVAEYEMDPYKSVRYVSVDREGRYIVAATGSRLQVWEAGTTNSVLSTMFHTQVGDPCFGPEGEFLALGLGDGQIIVLDVGSWGMRSTQGPVGPISVLTFSPDGRFLGIGTMAGSAQLWRLDTGLPLRFPQIHEGGAVWDVAFSPDGRRFLSASGKPAIQAWSTETGEPQESFEQKEMTVYSIAVSPDGRYLALADDTGEVEILQASDWRRTLYNYRHQMGTLNLTFSPVEPHLLASAGNDGLVWLADVERRQNVRSFQHHTSVYRVAFSPDGQTLATGLGDGSVYIWRITDEQPMAAFIAHTYTVTGLAFGPDGRFLATASPGEQVVRFWDVSSPRVGQPGTRPIAQTIQQPVHTLEHPTLLYDVAFSPDGRLLATGLDVGTIWLWAVP
ncbi:MAG: WD40 repeat domain-containing protein [Anaerolineae bacterium]|nr:WD40 repeat domain-containing protein [Anaerolineae bacterium]